MTLVSILDGQREEFHLLRGWVFTVSSHRFEFVLLVA